MIWQKSFNTLFNRKWTWHSHLVLNIDLATWYGIGVNQRHVVELLFIINIHMYHINSCCTFGTLTLANNLESVCVNREDLPRLISYIFKRIQLSYRRYQYQCNSVCCHSEGTVFPTYNIWEYIMFLTLETFLL